MAAHTDTVPTKSDPQTPMLVSEKPQPNPRNRKKFWTKVALITLAVLIPIIVLVACLATLLPKHHKSNGSTSSSGSGSGVNSSSNNAAALVHLDYASYQGTRLSAGVNQYLGVRFAAPPIGNLRWRAPQPPQKMSDTQNASAFGPTCLAAGVGMVEGQSEDCLFANVYTPSNATTSSKLPVWIYIQGGGYVGDYNANYNGTQVVQTGNVVLVNFNYRVGAWGFLASEKVRNNGDLNVGLLDQRAAFNWTRKYIQQFGGDPDHIVIHGASAGAGSVGHHLVAYGGRNDSLFVGAVTQSPYFQTEMTVAELEWQFDLFSSNTGCNGTSDEMACLRNLDTKTLQAADYTSPFPGHKVAPRRSWGPYVDGDLLPDLPMTLFQTGKFLSVPMMIGDEPDEGTLFAPNASTAFDVQQFFNENYPHLNQTQLQSITAQYTPNTPVPQHATWFAPAAHAYGESTLICPGITMARSMANTSSPVWQYSFNASVAADWNNGLGSYHTIDTGAIFGPDYNGAPTQASDMGYENVNKGLVPLMMGYYLSFVKTLNPNTLKSMSAPSWDVFGSEQRRLSVTTDQSGMEDVPAALLNNCRFWENLRLDMEI